MSINGVFTRKGSLEILNLVLCLEMLCFKKKKKYQFIRVRLKVVVIQGTTRISPPPLEYNLSMIF